MLYSRCLACRRVSLTTGRNPGDDIMGGGRRYFISANIGLNGVSRRDHMQCTRDESKLATVERASANFTSYAESQCELNYPSIEHCVGVLLIWHWEWCICLCNGR